jgi:hypothetical protein
MLRQAFLSGLLDCVAKRAPPGLIGLLDDTVSTCTFT